MKRSSKLRKYSKRDLPKAKKLLLERAKKVVRERDRVCQARGVDGRGCWGHLSASHIYPESHYQSMKFDLDNMIGMCHGHHIYWWHKHPVAADEWLKKYIGMAKYNELKRRSRESHVIDFPFLEAKSRAIDLYLSSLSGTRVDAMRLSSVHKSSLT